MGNYRFRFSNIIPSSWLHTSTTRNKLSNKLNNKITKTQLVTSPSSSSLSSSQRADYQRKSYYFTRNLSLPDPTNRIQNPSPGRTHLPDVGRKSSRKQPRRKLASPELNPAARCSCRITPETVSTDSESSDSEVKSPEQSLTCSCKTSSSYDVVYEKVDLAPIKTKHAKQNEFGSGKWVIDGRTRNLSLRVVKEGIIGISTTNTRSPVRKLKGNGYSPRLGNRVRINGINGVRRRNGNRNRNGDRRSLTESMAVVKTSVDPGRDFRESMVEMITENNMRSPKELEDLLACYLALNSDEYHDLIIKVFKQIWFESGDIRV
ncbi:hypothetical protein SSX86_022691 [Deinandra increscens subsp. villosa]|uniref:Transcription repressor n=1 Tax=Deinandra increscens subsp. villosa TaxID=3103831 RepID=A0AAP0GRE9_9ASTR